MAKQWWMILGTLGASACPHRVQPEPISIPAGHLRLPAGEEGFRVELAVHETDLPPCGSASDFPSDLPERPVDCMMMDAYDEDFMPAGQELSCVYQGGRDTAWARVELPGCTRVVWFDRDLEAPTDLTQMWRYLPRARARSVKLPLGDPACEYFGLLTTPRSCRPPPRAGPPESASGPDDLRCEAGEVSLPDEDPLTRSPGLPVLSCLYRGRDEPETVEFQVGDCHYVAHFVKKARKWPITEAERCATEGKDRR